MNYEKMSDLEINRAVADHDGGYIGDCGHGEDLVKVGKKWRGIMMYLENDYCGNPNDTWHLIVKHKLCIQPPHIGSDLWFCFDVESGVTTSDKNPLRAAAITFIKLMDAKNDA